MKSKSHCCKRIQQDSTYPVIGPYLASSDLQLSRSSRRTPCFAAFERRMRVAAAGRHQAALHSIERSDVAADMADTTVAVWVSALYDLSESRPHNWSAFNWKACSAGVGELTRHCSSSCLISLAHVVLQGGPGCLSKSLRVSNTV